MLNVKKVRVNLVKSDQKGMGLVEVIAALGISVIVITALVSLTIFTLRSSQRSKVLLQSSKEANTLLELVRAHRDNPVTTWDAFITALQNQGCKVACNMMGPGGSPAEVTNVAGKITALSGHDTLTFFKATTLGGGTVSVDEPVRIAVFSYYNIGGEAKVSSLYTDLTNWRNR